MSLILSLFFADPHYVAIAIIAESCVEIVFSVVLIVGVIKVRIQLVLFRRFGSIGAPSSFNRTRGFSIGLTFPAAMPSVYQSRPSLTRTGENNHPPGYWNPADSEVSNSEKQSFSWSTFRSYNESSSPVSRSTT